MQEKSRIKKSIEVERAIKGRPSIEAGQPVRIIFHLKFR